MKGRPLIRALCASGLSPSPLSPFPAASPPSRVLEVAAHAGALMPLTSLF